MLNGTVRVTDAITKVVMLSSNTLLNNVISGACVKQRIFQFVIGLSLNPHLHVPSDVIVDASMPVVICDSGKMWNKDNK